MKFAYLIEPPFNYIDGTGRLTGCDVELARLVFDRLNIKKFEPVKTEFSELLQGLSDGRWQMTTGLFATDERRKHAIFSRPIWSLPDGLLVASGNPLGLSGYRSVAADHTFGLAVIRDQFQHRSAIEFGISADQVTVFETYEQAARAVRVGTVDAYASVARAHHGFIDQNPDWELDMTLVPREEKPPACGSFAFHPAQMDLRKQVDDVLADVLGTEEHRKLVAAFGFSPDETNLVAVQ